MGQIAEVLKYDNGSNTTFVWKHPLEDFNSLTQLIVHESQEAIFMMNGQILDVFGAGRYTLETQNIPKISKFFNRIVGDQTPFHCEVYFVNKVEQMAIRWGTDSKVQYVDPTYSFPLSIGASGEMSLRVENSKKLLLKLVGTESDLSQEKLVRYFRAFLMTKIKTYIAQTIKAEKINIFEIDEHLQSISSKLLELLYPDFLDYGISLERFFVTTFVKPESDPNYERFKNLHFNQYADIAEAKLRQQVSIIDEQTKAQQTIIASQALAQKHMQEGYTYQQERGFDVSELVAKNESIGQFTNLGVGLGTMAGIGGTMAGVMGNAMSDSMNNFNTNQKKSIICKKCNCPTPDNSKFCLNCGEEIVFDDPNKVLCPNCKKLVPKGKFCFECGYKFIKTCQKCGKEVENGNFCLNCGEKL